MAIYCFDGMIKFLRPIYFIDAGMPAENYKQPRRLLCECHDPNPREYHVLGSCRTICDITRRLKYSRTPRTSQKSPSEAFIMKKVNF